MTFLQLQDAQNPTALNLHNLPITSELYPATLIYRFGKPAIFTKAIKSAARLYLLFWVNFHKPQNFRLKRLKHVNFNDKTQTATVFNDYNGEPLIVTIDLILKATANGFLQLKHYN